MALDVLVLRKQVFVLKRKRPRLRGTPSTPLLEHFAPLLVCIAIFDHDSKFDADLIAFLTATGLKRTRTSVQAPGQNGLSERWVGSCRREMLDDVIALDEEHQLRLLCDSGTL